MYTITLADGTKIGNLVLNGNNYISDEIIPGSVFDGNLDTVTITNGKTTEIYTDMMLYSNRIDGGKSWFVIGEKTEEQKLRERVSSLEEQIDMLLSGVTADE